MAFSPVMLTNEGTRKLKQELQDLLSEQHSQKLKEEESNFLSERIEVIKEVLNNAIILSDEKEAGDSVEIGGTITVLDLEYMDEYTYTIVHPLEADPLKHKIALDSPIAKAILGKRLFEKVDIPLPGGVLSYKIVDIQNCKK
ncbi:GreA/GreB family elongation factor [Fictibacillus sp. Mic-4]|uniref:GreA/GreB family elongation factor n=1 Tax=Fictibacillus TaxID=1329200 RepID=UPI000417D0B0|nr:GreA/GreB family elongation factor [Fictibacillus gelatini]